MSENECITLDDLLNEFGDDVNKDSDLLLENIGNFCSSLGFLSKNLNSMEEKKTLKLLKLIRKQQNIINQNVYSIIEKLSNNDENFVYKDYLNGYDDELLYPKTINTNKPSTAN